MDPLLYSPIRSVNIVYWNYEMPLLKDPTLWLFQQPRGGSIGNLVCTMQLHQFQAINNCIIHEDYPECESIYKYNKTIKSFYLEI